MNNQEEQMTEQTSQSPKKVKAGLATAGMIIGIVAVVFSLAQAGMVMVIAFLLGIIAFVFGIISLVKKKGKGKAVAAVVLGAVAVIFPVIIAASQVETEEKAESVDEQIEYISGDKTEEILDKYLTVKMGDFTVVSGDYYDDTKLKVTIKNISAERRSFSIKIEAIDKDGNRIDSDYIYSSDLGAGQGEVFEIFKYVPDEDVENMKQAEFQIAEITMY